MVVGIVGVLEGLTVVGQHDAIFSENASNRFSASTRLSLIAFLKSALRAVN